MRARCSAREASGGSFESPKSFIAFEELPVVDWEGRVGGAEGGWRGRGVRHGRYLLLIAYQSRILETSRWCMGDVSWMDTWYLVMRGVVRGFQKTLSNPRGSAELQLFFFQRSEQQNRIRAPDVHEVRTFTVYHPRCYKASNLLCTALSQLSYVPQILA